VKRPVSNDPSSSKFVVPQLEMHVAVPLMITQWNPIIQARLQTGGAVVGDTVVVDVVFEVVVVVGGTMEVVVGIVIVVEPVENGNDVDEPDEKLQEQLHGQFPVTGLVNNTPEALSPPHQHTESQTTNVAGEVMDACPETRQSDSKLDEGKFEICKLINNETFGRDNDANTLFDVMIRFKLGCPV
jgi:hypothetical protein